MTSKEEVFSNCDFISFSWIQQQISRRVAPIADVSEDAENAEDARRIKGILNKLTLKKLTKLSEQLLECDFRKVRHVQTLTQEILCPPTAPRSRSSRNSY